MFGMLKEFSEYLRAQKKMWLFPLIIILMVVGVVVTVATSSTIAPFIYTLF